MPNVALVQCIHRAQHPANAISIAGALAQLPYPVIWEQPQSDALVTRGRAVAASRFLEQRPDGDILVFIDDDIAFEPQALKYLIDTCAETEEIACGLYVVRDTAAPHPAIAAFPGQHIKVGRDQERMPIKWGATGFMAVHRQALLRIRELLPWVYSGPVWFWPFFDTMILRDGEYLSEDFAFCERAIRAGVKTWLDPRIELRHEGVRTYTIQDLQSSGVGQRTTITIDEGGPDRTAVIDDLAAYLEVERDEVSRKLSTLPLNDAIADAWRTKPPGTDADVVEFYQENGDLWLWELAKFNTSPGYWTRSVPAMQLVGNVLDVGAGIGSLCIQLSTDSRKMHYCDVSNRLADFAEFRFDRHGLEIPVYMGIEEVPSNSMDGILATDVLEHIAPDEIEWMVGQFMRVLRDGGRLVEISDFDSKDGAYPQHFETADRWEYAFRDAGLVQSAGFWYKPVAAAVAAS